MKRIGIIGSGDMGTGIARLAVAAGYEVLIANSRGPAALQGLIDELGPQARAGDVREAAEFGEIPVLAIPLGAYPTMPEGALAGKTILSTANHYPGSDGSKAGDTRVRMLRSYRLRVVREIRPSMSMSASQ